MGLLSNAMLVFEKTAGLDCKSAGV